MRRKTAFALWIILTVVVLTGSAVAATYYHKPNDYSAHNYMVDGGSWLKIPYGAEVTIDTSDREEWFVYLKPGGRGASLDSAEQTRFSKDPPSPGELKRAEEIAAYGGYKSTAVAPCLVPLIGGQGEKRALALGATVQYVNENGKATGTKYDQINFDGSISVIFTANSFSGKKFIGWSINGETPQSGDASKTLTLTNLDQTILVEAVFR